MLASSSSTLSAPSSARSTSAPTTDSRHHLRHRRAETRRIRPTSSSCRRTPARSRRSCALCNEHRVPLVPRGGGTGYTGGSVPTRGGVVLSLERMNRILEIDEANLLAVVEPNVITGDLQDAVEKVGLFYPPDPASLRQSRDRRQRRRMRRRAARLQVRHDQAATCSASRRCCRPARSSRPAARS